ncbi:MAG: 50S ribosomal protein L32 [Chloroflexi bacterium]|nr:50S ribosomal protein L32 [Chloroflexota bacterium]
MTPLPKRKQSKGRTRRRRAHQALTALKLVECPSCHEMRRPHHICPSCGSYDGETVIEVKAD